MQTLARPNVAVTWLMLVNVEPGSKRARVTRCGSTQVLPTTRTKISGTHNDNLDNLMLLLRGQKEFLMYSALDAANVYPRTWTSAQKHADPQDGPENGDHSFGNFIPIDPSSPDVDEYPRARKARPIRCVVNEGAVLG